MAFTLLGDRIAIRPILQDMDKLQISPGGVFISHPPQSLNVKYGEIVALGNNLLCTFNDEGEILYSDLNLGDMVFYDVSNGFTVKLDGEDLVIIDEKDLIAIIIE